MTNFGDIAQFPVSPTIISSWLHLHYISIFVGWIPGYIFPDFKWGLFRHPTCYQSGYIIPVTMSPCFTYETSPRATPKGRYLRRPRPSGSADSAHVRCARQRQCAHLARRAVDLVQRSLGGNAGIEAWKNGAVKWWFDHVKWCSNKHGGNGGIEPTWREI